MAGYICEVCGNLIDGDWNVGTEYKDGEVCESCAETVFDEDGNIIEE